MAAETTTSTVDDIVYSYAIEDVFLDFLKDHRSATRPIALPPGNHN